MRNNPLPLIVPCHRVIKSDGSLGGFFGKEGIVLKRKMIDLEFKGK
jgi:O6-methylguanine-DNA--protein-cysteine methyltransferase